MDALTGRFVHRFDRFGGQRYEDIKQRCQLEGRLWEDPVFPADASSLWDKPPDGLTNQDITWQRPGDLCERPRLFVDGADALDVKQGNLGNCWFVASCGVLAHHRNILNHVIPNSKAQEWDDVHPERYAGIFRFRFWLFGKWTEVVIDDRLPVCNGRLLFVHSADNNEFWSALLEKAYAKVHGQYSKLDGGNAADALVDFTAGITREIDLNGHEAEPGVPRKMLYKEIRRAGHRAMMSAAILVKSTDQIEAVMPTGLVVGHAYGIRSFAAFNRIPMVQMYNPWGKQEWKGAWSDGSPEWDALPVSKRPAFSDDGSFWMSMDDFCEQFDSLTITRTVNTAILSLERTWYCKAFRGAWDGDMAGGCKNEPGWLEHNPQFLFTQRKTSTVHVSLLQEGHADRENLLVIGLLVFQVEENRKYRLVSRHKVLPPGIEGHAPHGKVAEARQGKGGELPIKSGAQQLIKKLFKSDADVTNQKAASARGCKSRYINAREVVVSARLRAGRYMIVPTTFHKGERGNFLLRIYSNDPTEAREAQPVVERLMTQGCLGMCRQRRKKHTGVLRVTVVSGTNLPRRSVTIGPIEDYPDPYVVLKVEKTTVRSHGIRHFDPHVKGTAAQNPLWGLSFVFYVHEPTTSELILHVRDDIPVLRDPLFGEARIALDQFTDRERVGKAWDVVLPLGPPLVQRGQASGKVAPDASLASDSASVVALRLTYTDEMDL
eukprot:m.15458 g.15458  ORF g.15458 m.15458 type:complete len:717 (-) comp3267_c0_seq1:140-2290(-)